MNRTNLLTEIAVMISFAVVLEAVFTGLSAFFPFLALPYGGRVSLALLPIFYVVYKHGIRLGVMAGASYGLLNLMLVAQLWHWGSFFLDYLFAFGFIGFAYVGVLLFGKNIKGFIAVIVIGSFIRLFFHFLSGIILFGDYAGDYGFDNVFLYSIVYNSYYVIPSMFLILIVGLLLFERLKKIEFSR